MRPNSSTSCPAALPARDSWPTRYRYKPSRLRLFRNHGAASGGARGGYAGPARLAPSKHGHRLDLDDSDQTYGHRRIHAALTRGVKYRAGSERPSVCTQRSAIEPLKGPTTNIGTPRLRHSCNP